MSTTPIQGSRICIQGGIYACCIESSLFTIFMFFVPKCAELFNVLWLMFCISKGRYWVLRGFLLMNGFITILRMMCTKDGTAKSRIMRVLSYYAQSRIINNASGAISSNPRWFIVCSCIIYFYLGECCCNVISCHYYQRLWLDFKQSHILMRATLALRCLLRLHWVGKRRNYLCVNYR